MAAHLQILDVELEDLQAIGEIFFASMQNDFIWLNLYSKGNCSSMSQWAKLYADEIREAFEKEKQNGLVLVKCCEPGSTIPIGFARWQSPQFYKHSLEEEAEGEKPKTEAEKKMAEIEDTSFLESFSGAQKRERRKRFPEGKAHWYLALLCVAPEHQRKGVGQALLSYGLNHADSNTPLYLESSPFGKPLYIKNGFHVTGYAEILGSIKAGPEELKQVEDAEGKYRWALSFPLMLREGGLAK